MRPFLPYLAVIALAIGLYGRTIAFDFAYDDIPQIRTNPQVTSKSDQTTWRDLARIFQEPTHLGDVHSPLSTLTYRVTSELLGLTPSVYHATNVALYTLVCVGVYALFATIMAQRTTALLSALLFTTHPIHVEAIANVIGRAELGAALGAMTAIFAARTVVQQPGAVVRGVVLAFVIFAAVLAGALFKESSITIIGVLPFIAILGVGAGQYPKGVHLIRALTCITPALGGALVALLMRKYALGPNFILHVDGKIWPENPLFNLSFAERIVPSLVVLGDYFRLLVLPINLAADYSSMPDMFFARVYSWEGLVSGLLVAGSAAAILGSRSLEIKTWGLWVFVTFGLTISLVTPIGTVLGERLAFLPSIGACALLGHTLVFVSSRTPALRILPALVIGLFVIRTALRIPVWENNQTLFSQTVLDAPWSPKAHYMLGVHYRVDGKNTVAAREELEIAVTLHPGYVLALSALADIALERKDWHKLQLLYRRLLELTPDNTLVRNNLDKLGEYLREPRP